ncbi:hypothetical protein [Trueperella abortisuis]|uniref:Uncharacterized protein n=1 Tax=Trueperella abortisuis TaxID=445930 RepID=A0ABT9PIT5_9ACTO|nr:hypothetical protein [Trueperella abortisuis]MDP9832397.1 hypothetical protein [Trueperella abortisuis]
MRLTGNLRSGVALNFLKNKTDEEYEQVREDYKYYLRKKRHGKKYGNPLVDTF